MFASSKRHNSPRVDIWPGFVDALASLLMVIIFVLMTFVVAQFYLTDALSNRDLALAQLNRRVSTLTTQLSTTEDLKQEAEEKIGTLAELIQHLREDLAIEESAKDKITAQAARLEQSITALNRKLVQINRSLRTAQSHEYLLETTLEKTKDQLNLKLSEKIKALDSLNAQILALSRKNTTLQTKMDALTKKANSDIGLYRSEFFSKLKIAIGNRTDVRVVGDRFVFQSEVLFEVASAEIGSSGKKGLTGLAAALKEIATKIPKGMNWILRVDGHTDKRPINTPQFPSNWELSSARAISVVRYLISQGIDPNRLVAAGFGPFQPLESKTAENTLDRNRRIEFKLDQR